MQNVDSTQTSIDGRYEQQSISRLRDWTDFCLSEYNIDAELSTVIATVVMPCPRNRPLWLVIETDRHPFWNHLSAAFELLSLPPIYNCASLRHNGPRSVAYSSENMMTWMSTRDSKPRLMIDTMAQTRECWKGIHIYHPYWAVCQESLRYYSKVDTVRLPSEDSEKELARLLKLLIDQTHRRLFAEPVELPSGVLLMVDWLSELSNEVCPGPQLTENLSLLPSCHAVLHGRSELDDSDWAVLQQTLGGFVKQWQRSLLRLFHDEVCPYGKNIQLRHKTGSSRLNRLPNMDRIETLWRMEKSTASRHLRALIESRMMEPLRLIQYKDPTRIDGFGRRKVRTLQRGARTYYDLTVWGEQLTAMLYDDEFDIRLLED